MAFVAGLGPGMGLVALVAGLHDRPIGLGIRPVVGYIAVAVDAQGLLVRVELMGDKHDPDRLRGGLLSPGDGGVAAHASLVHQVIAGRKGVSQDNASSGGMAIHAARGFGMSPRGEPPGGNVLILVTGQAEKRMAGSKPDHAEAWNGRQEQEDGNDQSPCAFGQFR